ncbi:hypothetical protein [Leifsonia shinshuensis]
MPESPTTPGPLRRVLNALREAWVGDDPDPEQLTGLDILGFFGQGAYDAWKAEGCPPVTFDQLAAHQTSRPALVEDDRPDWGEVSRWIDEHGRGRRVAERLTCGLCDGPVGEDATVGDVLDHLRDIHQVRGALASKLIHVEQTPAVEEVSHG